MAIKASTLIFSLSLVGCIWDPPSERPVGAGDTAFTVAGIPFPNEAAYGRANLNPVPDGRIRLFLEKCKTRDSIRVGFIGGSITAGAITSNSSFRFSTLLTTFLKQRHLGIRHLSEINAGIGSTGSRFGVSRIDKDLLEASPDLIVIEFAVNDYGAGSDSDIQAWMEGMIRRCLRTDAAVILLFTARGDGTNTQSLHAAVGAHYGLPMISYRDAIWPFVASNEAPWSAFFYDDPHPNDGGHRIIAHLLYTYLKNASKKQVIKPVPPAAFGGEVYEKAGILEAEDTSLTVNLGGWTKETGHNNRLSFSSGPGNSVLSLSTRVRELTLGIRVGPSDTSSVLIRKNGVPERVINNHAGFEYTRFVKIYSDSGTDPRSIEIVHSGGPRFRIDYVLHAGEPE